ncbi:MAG: succinate dehydrogenase, cytochrome b556 subunit [Actinomycetota bacterium]
MAVPAKAPYNRTFYKGGGGMWSWILHRGSGLAVFGFLLIHILDTSLVMFGPAAYNTVAKFYEGPVFRPLEVLLMFFVIYHAFNGLRVIVLDLWPRTSRYQAVMTLAVTVITAMLFIPSAFIMLRPLFV